MAVLRKRCDPRGRNVQSPLSDAQTRLHEKGCPSPRQTVQGLRAAARGPSREGGGQGICEGKEDGQTWGVLLVQVTSHCGTMKSVWATGLPRAGAARGLY